MIVTVSKKTIEFVFKEETGGRGYYKRFGERPYWPKGASGITVGAGYDLGYSNLFRIKQDWKGYVSDATIKLMQSVAGLRGAKAANALTSNILNSISISYDVAYRQYVEKVYESELHKTVIAFPKVEQLNPDTIGILCSVVYNRGTKMDDIDKKSRDRLEMRVIKSLVPNKNYKGIAAQIRSMKRLWDGVPDYAGDKEQKFSGLVTRREREATIVENSDREYLADELQKFEF